MSIPRERGYRRTEQKVAQDRILGAIVGLALQASEAGQVRVADAIRDLGASIATRWRITNVHGLPGTFASSYRGEKILPNRMPE